VDEYSIGIKADLKSLAIILLVGSLKSAERTLDELAVMVKGADCQRCSRQWLQFTSCVCIELDTSFN